MRLAALSRLIEAFEFHQLLELSVKYLVAIGYQNPRLTDGWRDGGTDLRVLTADGTPSARVVQTSVEKNWKGKLAADAEKSITNYSATSFVYITSRRIPELDFAKMQTTYAKRGLALEKADNQALASIFHELDGGRTLLEIAGIVEATRPVAAPARRFEEQAAFSYLFLSEDAQNFRRSMLDRIIEGQLSHDTLPRRDLVARVSRTARLSDGQTSQVESRIDSLLTRGHLSINAGALRISDGRRRQLDGETQVVDAAWIELEAALVRYLRTRVPASSRANVSGDTLISCLGAAIVLSSETSSGEVAPELYDGNVLRPRLRERLNELNTVLADLGITDTAARRRTLDGLIDIVSESDVAAAISAAELFLALNDLNSAQLGRALGGTTFPAVFLDPSVAMPMLLSSLYGLESRADFIAAHAFFRQAQVHDIRLILPGEYLEESATHLIDAWRDYGQFIDSVPELVDSTNAYVAHYARLRSIGEVADFSSYMEGLGVTSQVVTEEGDYHDKRRVVERQLRKVYKSYGIEVLHAVSSRTSRKGGQIFNEIQRVAADHYPHRPELLISHDAQVTALLDQHTENDSAILCTHDGLMFTVQQRATKAWQIIRPGALADLLALAQPVRDGSRATFVATAAWTRYVLEDEQHTAARVWDWLARNKSSQISDARQIAHAKKFVGEFIARGRPTSSDAISRMWSNWEKPEAEESGT